MKQILILLLIIGAVSVTAYSFVSDRSSKTPTVSAIATTKQASTAKTTKPKTVNHCQDTAEKTVIVSIAARHLWACSQGASVYDSAVVTGYTQLASNITPLGTYHIYDKSAAVHLKGHDERGSWDDPVQHWMPFLRNQYGAYGFHDADWRDPSAFGNISPDTLDASHGCVEVPDATSLFLYNWTAIGTTVMIET